jgi:hypothetical protein
MATAISDELYDDGVKLHGFTWRSLTASGSAVTFPQGRRCSQPSCGTRLSRYNPDDACALHGGWSDRSGTTEGPVSR